MGKKIAINGRFLSARYKTGVERVAENISLLLPEMDSKNQYFIFGDKNAIDKKKYQKIKNLTWIDFSFSKRSFILKHIQEHFILPRKLKKEKVDLLLNLTNTAPLGFLKKSLLLVHCLHFMIFPHEYNFVFRCYYKWLLPKLVKKSKKVITISQLSKKEIKKYLKVQRKDISVIYNGVADMFFKKSKVNVFKKFKLNKKYILFVGSLNPRKNLGKLVEAYKSSKVQADYDLVAVGNDVGTFKKINKDKSIKFINEINDKGLVALYQNANLFVFPSKHEGFGLPPVEAMAAGTSVVASDIPAIKEVGGDAVFYINPKSIKSIQNGLEKVLAEKTLQNKLIQNGKKRIKQFTWKKAVAEYIRIINS